MILLTEYSTSGGSYIEFCRSMVDKIGLDKLDFTRCNYLEASRGFLSTPTKIHYVEDPELEFFKDFKEGSGIDGVFEGRLEVVTGDGFIDLCLNCGSTSIYITSIVEGVEEFVTDPITLHLVESRRILKYGNKQKVINI